MTTARTDASIADAGNEGASPPLLEVEDLVTQFSRRRGLMAGLASRDPSVVRAVDSVSLRVHAGELVALVGESGCGKTTTAQTIHRLVDPVSGAIRLAGRDITTLSQRQLRSVRRTMQLIYQDPYESLDPRFRVRQTVEEPLRVHRVGGSAGDRLERVREVLERVGLSPAESFLDRYPHELSGGQRQRVAIAASLVVGPALITADEPTSMLDVSARASILHLLDQLRRTQGVGILMITHDLSTAAHFADRIAVMYLGRVVEEGRARDVVHAPQHPYTRALLSVVPHRDPRIPWRPQVLTGEAPDPTKVPPGCRFAPRCPIAEDRCRTVDPGLTAVGSGGHRAACVLVRAGGSASAESAS